MMTPILAAFIPSFLGMALSLMSIFLILLILVQRGRGGGLAGALGGMGGSSAFGAKAGDVFTRITAVAALIWIVLCIAMARWGAAGGSALDIQGPVGGAPPGTSAQLEPKGGDDDASKGAASEPGRPGPGEPTASGGESKDAAASGAPAESSAAPPADTVDPATTESDK
jgi:preprotein translocase subunit SecG